MSSPTSHLWHTWDLFIHHCKRCKQLFFFSFFKWLHLLTFRSSWRGQLSKHTTCVLSHLHTRNKLIRKCKKRDWVVGILGLQGVVLLCVQSALMHFKALLCIQCLHKVLSWWQLEFVGWGREGGMEGGRVEIVKLWEPRQCAEDEGRERWERGRGGVESWRHNGVGMRWLMRLHWHQVESEQSNQSNGARSAWVNDDRVQPALPGVQACLLGRSVPVVGSVFMLARDAWWPGECERCTHADAAVVFHSLFSFFFFS